MLKSSFFTLVTLLATFCFLNDSHAITLSSGDEDFVTSEDITTDSMAIESNLAGTEGRFNTIINNHTLTTTESSKYGIKTTKEFNHVTNYGTIITQKSSGRGISVKESSIVTNEGTISTLSESGYASYGIRLDGDNNSATSSGSISTVTSSGVYLRGDFNQFTNSGEITTTAGNAYGIVISNSSDSVAAENEDNYTEVTNSGTINSHDHGINNGNDYTHIDNSGIINTLDDDEIYGIHNDAAYAVITNSGTINSARYAFYNTGDGAESIFNNSGILNGDLRLGNSTLNILGGSITGIVNGYNEAGVNIGSSLTSVTYTQENYFEDLSTLTINTNSSFNVNSTLQAQTIFIADGGNLNLNSGANLEVTTIRGLTDGVGNVNLSGIDFSGNLGISGSSLANINIASGATFTSSSDIFSSDISTSGTLNFYANNGETIHGNLIINSGGSVNIANQSQIISGDFTLAENGSLATSLSGNSLGNLAISGDATIADGAKLSLNIATDNGYLANGTRFTILSSDGTTNFDAISTENILINDGSSNIYGLLRFTTIADGSSLYLEANHLAAEEISTNKNIQNIYSVIGEIGTSASGNLRLFQSYLDNANLAPDALNLTIKQIAPFPTKANLITTQNIVNNSIKIDEKRLNKARFNPKMPRGFWVQAFGNNLDQSEVKDDGGFGVNSVGVIFGLDEEISEDVTAGASFSFARSTVKTEDDSKSNLISSYQLSAFKGFNFDEYFFDLIGAFAFHQYGQTKTVEAIEVGSGASYNGQTYAVKAKIGKIKSLKYGLKLIPEFSLNFLHSKIDGYKEIGSGSLDLKVSAVSANSLEARVGTSLGWITNIPDQNEFTKFYSLSQNILRPKYHQRQARNISKLSNKQPKLRPENFPIRRHFNKIRLRTRRLPR